MSQVFIGRAIFYFAGLDVLRVPVEQTVGGSRIATGDDRLIGKMRALSAPGLVVFTFVTTFAFIDWIMSLEPHWFSTIYGAMFLIGQMLEAFAFMIALVIVLSRRGPLRELRHQAASSRPRQHDVRVHGAVGVSFVFAIPDHLGGKSAGRNSVVSAAAAQADGDGWR